MIHSFFRVAIKRKETFMHQKKLKLFILPTRSYCLNSMVTTSSPSTLPPPSNSIFNQSPLSTQHISPSIGIIQSPMYQQRLSRSYSSNPRNHYETLGLSNSSCSSEEIKRAYFETAKRTHPDLHPNDPKAKAKFQQVNHAYQVLKDPHRKATYDMSGRDEPSSGVGENYDDWGSNVDAKAWQEVWQEYGFENYISELQDHANRAAQDIRERNDWTQAQEFAEKNKLLLLGVFVPLALFLRYPPLVLGGLRIAFNIASNIYFSLPKYQRNMLMNRIWKVVKDSQKK
jgi:hypothetical protein